MYQRSYDHLSKDNRDSFLHGGVGINYVQEQLKSKYFMKLNLFASSIISSLFVFQSYPATETKVFDYAYDDNGNNLSIDEVINNKTKILYQYTYNDINQMASFEDIQNNKSFTYGYYPNGKRLNKKGLSELKQEEIIFYYDHYGQLMNEVYLRDNQTAKQSNYFSGLRFINDLVDANNSHLQYPMADKHNHPATINFSQNGSNMKSYHLMDYGELEQSHNNPNQIESDMHNENSAGLFNFELNPKIYGSGYYDSESNLQYMGARYYSADTQRFMAQDSYNLLNRYNYANGNPVINYDPDGHNAVSSITNHFIPKGIGGPIGLGASIIFDVAITSIALGANPSLGTLMLVGAISGGLSNSLGAMASESVESGKINAGDVRAQVVLGVSIGVLIGTTGNILSNSIRSPSLNWETIIENGKEFSTENSIVYRFNHKFYKYSLRNKENSFGVHFQKAERQQLLWNEFYRKSYNGKFNKYAIAEVKSFLIDDSIEKVLITPDLSSFAFNGMQDITKEMMNNYEADAKNILSRTISDINSDNCVLIDNCLCIIDFDMSHSTKKQRSYSLGTEEIFNRYPYLDGYKEI